MVDRKGLAPKDTQSLEKTKDELLVELEELVNNDPYAPYLASRRMSLAFQIKEFISFDGHFPSPVAYYAIAIIGSVFLLCNSYAEGSSRKFAWVFIGSALAAQMIEAIGRRRGRS
ncbi:MAG: hypothetical protein F6K19_23375 [Cyanothece sp. SIO1E1]|nr:hypothetical protein [Cyanothece sp. SIO1E1]